MPASDSTLTVSAIVVNQGRRDLLRECLSSLTKALAGPGEAGEIIVVDNGSTDGSCEVVDRQFPDVELIALETNRGFAAGVCEGLRRARGEWVLLLNNDATIDPEAVHLMLAAVDEAHNVGAVATQIRFDSEPPLINSAGIEIDRLGVVYDRLLGERPSASESEPTEVFGASAGGALYRRAMLEDVGGFDDSFFLYMEDADVAWRARTRGWRCLYVPDAIVHHHHSASAGQGSSLKYFHVGVGRVRLLAKNADARHLRRWALPMVAYDLAYVAFALVTGRTLAPLYGRVRGLREWRRYRRRSVPYPPIELAPVRGVRHALRRWNVFSRRDRSRGRIRRTPTGSP